MKFFLRHTLLISGIIAMTAQGQTLPLPEKINPIIKDKQVFQDPRNIHLSGWLGTRIDANEANRLAAMDVDRLLEGYRHRPGRQSWDGEHVGKWLHAASLSWAYTGDKTLRAKMDRVVLELQGCQLANGYLGTYLEKNRWKQWDVWAHKYNLLGLLSYIRYTGQTNPLATCRRMADLLCDTFGDEPEKKDIILAGHHVGMAPASVLEPMVLLYRFTGEPRYLRFCEYILRALEQPNGPKIISTLLAGKRVDKVGDGKAYEMLSCLNGVLEMYRTTGDHRLFEACQIAWLDIVKNRLYLTGTASYHEVFHEDYDLPNVNNVGETCVTVTWLQFNAQMLRLTDQAQYAEQLEQVVLNQLFGAQKCDGTAWGYYVQMEGKKPYSSTLDGHCCLSSGPRGIALIPTFAVTTDQAGVVVNLFETSTANLKLDDGTKVNVSTTTDFPANGKILIAIDSHEKKSFLVKIRAPKWSRASILKVNGKEILTAQDAGYFRIRRAWRPGDVVELDLELAPELVLGDHKNAGKAALRYGPLVLAADQGLRDARIPLSRVSLAGRDLPSLSFRSEPASGTFRTWPGARVFTVNAAGAAQGTGTNAQPETLHLLPFADAGQSGSAYKVWLPLPGAHFSGNLLLNANETRSRRGNRDGSINDDDLTTVVCTFNGKQAPQDWYALTLDEPAAISKVVFVHGRTFHDGGWFDASGAKPKIQIKRTKADEWEMVGELANYPETTSTNPSGLAAGEKFTWSSPTPIQAIAIRVLGKPACGDSPSQAFSSCAELQAF